MAKLYFKTLDERKCCPGSFLMHSRHCCRQSVIKINAFQERNLFIWNVKDTIKIMKHDKIKKFLILANIECLICITKL